jgi:aspartate/methionine/tyrosine aminotransferase
MKTSRRLDGIGEYYFSQKLREIAQLNAAGKNIINLGIGSPDLPPHPDVIKVLQEEVVKPGNHGYQSYKGSPVLRTSIAQWYRRWYSVELSAEDEILPLIGSKEGIMHICMTWLNKGDEVLVPDPGYPTYRSAAALAGGKCKIYELTSKNGFQPDFKKLEKKDLRKVKMLFANYPHMPSGQIPSEELYSRFVEFGRKHNILIVHDNPYSFLLPGWDKGVRPMSMLGVPGALDVVIELNSLSKSHNMAGWRLGMICAGKQRIEEVLRFKSNMDSGMFLPLQLAASKALSQDEDWFSQLNATYNLRRNKAYELLRLLDCSFSQDQAGMFAWGKAGKQYTDGYQLSDEVLYKSNVFITPGGIFGKTGKNFVRISLCADVEKIEEAIHRIEALKKK